MKKKLHFLACLILITSFAKAQVSFSDASSLIENNTLKGGVAMAICDMNDDGLDDIIRLSNAARLEIEYQQADGTFSQSIIGNVGNPWGMAIADVDRNGRNDIVVGGFDDGLRFVTLNTDGSFDIADLDGPLIFLQNANFADIDNDGNIDFFGCHDNGLSSIYRNDGNGALSFDTTLLNPESTVPSDNSGNYGSIWTDYDNDGDLDLYISKCRQGVDDPMDGRRLNLLFQNDGDGNYTDVAEAAGLLPMTQTWSSNFEDIDNDGDLDVVMINHFTTSQIYENNGDGTFTDITASTGIATELLDVGFGIQVAMEDFDNDTFIDILTTTTDGNHYLFMNNGDKTFTPVTDPFPTTNNDVIQSAAVGDANNDGFMDIIAGYADGFNNPNNNISDQLFLNDGSDNNWTKMILKGEQSNENGIGTRIELYGEWGMQIREVRAGESYGTQNSLTTHFGIGDATEIDQIIIRWPSGIVDGIDNPNINEQFTFNEGDNQLGIEDFSSTQLSIYPNPVIDVLTISTTLNISGEATIFDMNGKKLVEQTMESNNQRIDISKLPSGLYFVNVGGTTTKLLKK